MSYPLDGEKVTTPAGDYKIIWYVDECQDSPYDEGFTLLTRGSREQVDIRIGETQSAVSGAVQAAIDDRNVSGAAIVRYLRLAGKKGVSLVSSDYSPTVPSVERDELVYGVAWAPDDASVPDAYTEASLRQWTAWKMGDVYGYVVEGPGDTEVDSCWGFYGYADDDRKHIRADAQSAIDADVEDRVRRANLVGAGFVGIV